jgi:hypothetical protein
MWLQGFWQWLEARFEEKAANIRAAEEAEARAKAEQVSNYVTLICFLVWHIGHEFMR